MSNKEMDINVTQENPRDAMPSSSKFGVVIGPLAEQSFSSVPSTTNRCKDDDAKTVSETNAEKTPKQHDEKRSVPCCGPCTNFYGNNGDAVGFALDSVPRGVAIVGAMFLMTAILRLANQATNCTDTSTQTPLDTSDEGSSQPLTSPRDSCTGTVYGMLPSSLLTTIQIVSSVFVGMVLPLVGAVIDHTNHRRTIGRISALVLVILSVPPLFLTDRTWFAVLLLQVFVAFDYSIHSTAAYAYFAELGSGENGSYEEESKTLVKYSSSFTAVQFASTVITLAVVVGTSSALGIMNDDIATARLCQMFVLGVMVVFFGYSWAFCFSYREARSKVPDSSTLLTCGFRKILSTAKQIQNGQNYPAIKWFLVGVALSNAAVATLATVAITYLTDLIQLSSIENGIALLIMLLSSLPGAAFAAFVTKFVTPLRSLQACLVAWMIITAAAASFLYRPGQQSLAYIFAGLWGLAAGWFDPTERALYVTIMPKRQEAELMGLYLCAGQLLGWLPPLVFTAMNEAGVSLRIGLAMLGAYFLLSLFVYIFLMGDYEAAVQRTKSINDAAVVERHRLSRKSMSLRAVAVVSSETTTSDSTVTEDEEIDEEIDLESAPIS